MMNSRPLTAALGLFLLIVILPSTMIAVQLPVEEQADELQEQLETSIALESDLLYELRSLQMEKEQAEAQVEKLELEARLLQTDLMAADQRLLEATDRYAALQKRLTDLLVTVQMNGAGTRFDLLLSSESLPMFLRRLSALRQLDLDTSKLIRRIRDEKSLVESEAAEAERLLVAHEEKVSRLRQQLSEMQAAEAALETALSELQEKRQFYEDALQEMAESWSEAMKVFPALTTGFDRIIAEGAFPEDALMVSFGLSGIVAELQEETFQAILDADERLPNTRFQFMPEGVAIDIHSENLSVFGQFEVLDGVTLSFRPESGAHRGMELTEKQLQDLLRLGPLQFRMKPILDGVSIRSLQTYKGHLLLSVKLDFF